MVSSFFDIFTEISVDGGATWSPATTGPAEVSLFPRHPSCIMVTCPSDIVTSTTSSSGKVVTYPPPNVIVDFCTYTVSCSPASGSLFPIGTTTVNCTVTSSGGDVVQCSFNVTVLRLVIIPHWFPQLLLPPPHSEYISPQKWHQLYASGIIISNVTHRRFLQSFPPPPPGGAPETHAFGSEVAG